MSDGNINNSDPSRNQEVVPPRTTSQNAAILSPTKTTNFGGSTVAAMVSLPENVRSLFNPARPLFQMGQQIDESNHEMVNALTQQIVTIFTPMINNTNQSYEILAGLMARIEDFFGAPPQPNRPTPQVSNPRVVETLGNGFRVEAQRRIPERDEGGQIEHYIPRVVQRHQDADQVLRNIQQDAHIGHKNISNVVEQILVQNGINAGLHRPNFVSPLSEYVRQTELPRGWKIPKFTKFAGETGESTVEHVARYQTEADELENNENLKMKYFPSSLTKNAFTWFTTLPPQSLFSWNQLE
ncbi:uncharacterized protein LOC131614039 [Vicia villosa]|uniref:uncharacterized protein LOC131614039 n=1 Tax=Vicia villosa TaxID=3911 RepID=UPI00273BCACB|nr:uncharacterized protein LOC131614039 [Vicia villosa]